MHFWVRSDINIYKDNLRECLLCTFVFAFKTFNSRQMACTVLSALVSLYIQAAKTDNQPHGLWIVQRTNTLQKERNPPHINKVLQYGKA